MVYRDNLERDARGYGIPASETASLSDADLVWLLGQIDAEAADERYAHA
jgi:hypothetical protein